MSDKYIIIKLSSKAWYMYWGVKMGEFIFLDLENGSS